MKVRVFFMAMVVAFASFANVQAQQPEKPKHGNKVEFRVKRMADKLMLNDSQKEKFAPLYQEYLEAKAACRPQLVFGNELTDEQIEANLEAMMDVREKTLKIDKKYYKKLSKVLNAKQLDEIFGFKAQMGKRPVAPGKDVKAMPLRHFGKPGAQHGKHPMPKGVRKGGDRHKGHGHRMNGGCKNFDAVCKDGNECKMKADCKKECKHDGKCAKGDACPKAGECKKEDACKKVCPKAKDCKK